MGSLNLINLKIQCHTFSVGESTSSQHNMCNKWERWEPEEDKSRKKLVKTYRRRIEEQKEHNESWWDKEPNLGYDSKSDGEPDFVWDDDVKKGKGDDDNTA